MAAKEPTTYKVEMDRELMIDIIQLVDFCQDKFPFTKDTLWRLKGQLRKIGTDGCFRHNLIMEKFEVDSITTHVVCPKCCPKEYKEHKKAQDNKES